jgi:DnaJ family protein C protein 3
MRTKSTLRSLVFVLACYFPHGSWAEQQQQEASPGNVDVDSWSAGKLRAVSDEAMAAGDYLAAVGYLQKAAALEPESASNYFKLFKAHHRKRNYMDALQDISTAVEMEPAADKYRSQKAKLLVQVGQCEQAVAEYKLLQAQDEAAQHTAEECQRAIEYAEKSFFEKDYAVAAQLFQQALQYIEVASDLVWPKAQSMFWSGDYYGCISDTGQILKLHPKHVEAYQLRGDAYHRLGEHDNAAKHYREGLKWDPEHKGCKEGHKRVKALEKKKKKGQEAFDNRDFAAAVDLWTQALNIDPTHEAFNRPLQLMLSRAYSRMKDHTKAMEIAQQHIDEGESIEGLWALGEAQQAGEMYNLAVQTFQKAIEIANEGEEKQEANAKFKASQVALKQSKEKNYYKILDIARNANTKEVKKAYREMALKWHPDKNTDNQEEASKMFQDIAEAYEVLSNDELRAKYNRGEQVFENQGGQQRADPFAQFRNQGGRGGPQGFQGGFHFKHG